MRLELCNGIVKRGHKLHSLYSGTVLFSIGDRFIPNCFKLDPSEAEVSQWPNNLQFCNYASLILKRIFSGRFYGLYTGVIVCPRQGPHGGGRVCRRPTRPVRHAAPLVRRSVVQLPEFAFISSDFGVLLLCNYSAPAHIAVMKESFLAVKRKCDSGYFGDGFTTGYGCQLPLHDLKIYADEQ